MAPTKSRARKSGSKPRNKVAPRRLTKPTARKSGYRVMKAFPPSKRPQAPPTPLPSSNPGDESDSDEIQLMDESVPEESIKKLAVPRRRGTKRTARKSGHAPRKGLVPWNARRAIPTPVASSDREEASDPDEEMEDSEESAAEDELEKVADTTQQSNGDLDSDLKWGDQLPSFDEDELRDIDEGRYISNAEEGLSPFPEFIDYREEKYDPTELHCVLHCNHHVCKRTKKIQQHTRPQCECFLGERNLTTTAGLTQADIRAMEALSEDTPISIFRSDVGKFIDDVGNDNNYLNVSTLYSGEAFCAAAKGKHYTYRTKAARVAQEALITTMMQYFTRIFSSPLEQITGTSTISRKQLKLDITAVLGLTLWEFMGEYFSNEYWFSNGRSGYSPNYIPDLLKNSNVADAVWTAWDGAVDGLIMLCTVRHVRYAALLSDWTNRSLG